MSKPRSVGCRADKPNTLTPFINISPGQIITRNMEGLNWTSKDLAGVLGISEKTVKLLVNNKQSITFDTAALLGKAFSTSPEFWMNLEKRYLSRSKESNDTLIKTIMVDIPRNCPS